MSARFTLVTTPRFERDLEALSLIIHNRVVRALHVLETNPFGPAPRIKKLKIKGDGKWRLRVGQHRVRYDIMGRDVVLYRVLDRKDVYR